MRRQQKNAMKDQTNLPPAANWKEKANMDELDGIDNDDI